MKSRRLLSARTQSLKLQANAPLTSQERPKEKSLLTASLWLRSLRSGGQAEHRGLLHPTSLPNAGWPLKVQVAVLRQDS